MVTVPKTVARLLYAEIEAIGKFVYALLVLYHSTTELCGIQKFQLDVILSLAIEI